MAVLVGMGWCVGPGAAARASSDSEAELERDANDIEKRIAASGTLYGNASLDDYVQGIANRVTTPGSSPPIRVKVVRSPWPNAYVLPNGAAYVTTAMLTLLENEAELACVLAHEGVHLEDRHALAALQAQRGREVGVLLLLILAGVAGAHYSGIGGVGQMAAGLTEDAGRLWMTSAYSGYSRDNERAADHGGFERMTASGYDSGQAARVFEILLEAAGPETQAARPYYASHPSLEERIASYRSLLTASAIQSGRVGETEYVQAVGDLPLDQAEIWLRADMPVAAEGAVQRYVARRPDSARAHYLVGESWRQRTDLADWRARAMASYELAVKAGSPPPDALRQLGLLRREQGDMAAARAAFEQFLAAEPDAPDAGLVKLYLRQMAPTGD